MWLFTTIGFFSIVQKPGETGVQVRARAADDLDRLRERYLPTLSATISTPAGDYPFRALICHDDLAAGLGALVRDITYDNFKATVQAVQGPVRHDIYAQVWGVLARTLGTGPDAQFGQFSGAHQEAFIPWDDPSWDDLNDDELEEEPDDDELTPTPTE
jgi:hypothetical protein